MLNLVCLNSKLITKNTTHEDDLYVICLICNGAVL